MLGKPVEQRDLWTRDRIDRCLRRAAALPLTDHLPEPAGENDGVEPRPEQQRCVRGRIHGGCRDEDVDYAILGLDVLARNRAQAVMRGAAPSSADRAVNSTAPGFNRRRTSRTTRASRS
jgi:hypothetical protein